MVYLGGNAVAGGVETRVLEDERGGGTVGGVVRRHVAQKRQQHVAHFGVELVGWQGGGAERSDLNAVVRRVGGGVLMTCCCC